MTDVQPEVIDAASRALVRVPEPASIVRQTVSTGEVVAAQEAYHDLCSQLLDGTDYQSIGGKQFRKKSGWRKLAVAFNVSVELVTKEYERDGNGRIIRAEVVARATAPNGRTMDGLGACDLFEKCCIAATCRNRSQYHSHCVAGCTGAKHFSNPQHDLPATAHTRAVNRACADLFGMGEVSAEEITDNGQGQHQQQEEGPRDWFVDNGWTDEASARKTISELRDKIKALPDDVKSDLKAWMAKQDPVIDPAKTWTRPQVDAIESFLAPPAPDGQETGHTPAGDAGTPEGGGDAPEGEGEPQGDAEAQAEAQARADHAERMEDVAQEHGIQPPVLKAIHDLVKRLNAAGVDEELTRLRQHCEGKIGERRRRLELAVLMERVAEAGVTSPTT